MIKRPNLLDGEDLPPEPRQKRSIDKRERLKSAALASFGEQGYECTSIDDIASRAGLAVGGFYLHFRSKRQLLISLMDELLDHLSGLQLTPSPGGGVREGLRALLSIAFSQDLRYLGAYRAWQEAVLSDAGLAAKQEQIHAWTTSRVEAVFAMLQRLPGARRGVDIPSLARAMDTFFWSLLGQAARLSKRELDEWLDVSVHLMYHAMFTDEAATAYKSFRPSSRTSRGVAKRSPARDRRPPQ